MNYFSGNKEAMHKLCEFDQFIIDGISNYIKHGIPICGFLTAVFSNDLFKAFERADETCREDLYKLVLFIYCYCPLGCHGSLEIVNSWIKVKNESI